MNQSVGLLNRFPEIHDQAFSQGRVEYTVYEPGDTGLFHQVPYQKFVVQVDGCRVGSVGTHQAFEPPVGGVDTMGEVGT